MQYADNSSLKITILYDNCRYQEGLHTDWGFSCLIQGAEKTILFDTGGNGQLLLENFSKLEIDPGIVDIIFLSHIHGDHTGGLLDFLKINSRIKIITPNSFPAEFLNKIKQHEATITKISVAQEICRDVFSTGEMGNHIKEHSLIIRTEQGLILITGCAHPGIIEIIERSTEVGGDTILFTMGGFHLRNYPQTDLEQIVNEFIQSGIRFVGPSHCTGELARKIFKAEFESRFIEMGVGRIIFPVSLVN